MTTVHPWRYLHILIALLCMIFKEFNFLELQLLCTRKNIPMDGRTDGWTDGRTLPLLGTREFILKARNKKAKGEGKKSGRTALLRRLLSAPEMN